MKLLYILSTLISLPAISQPLQTVSETTCIEEKQTLYKEFIPLSFEERAIVGSDQVQPLKNKIHQYMTSNPHVVITDISIVSSSAKTPYYLSLGGKKVIDPGSEKKNLSLTEQRAGFADRILKELKQNYVSLSKVTTTTGFTLAGPDFIPLDLNTRFVTKQSPDYEKKVSGLYEEFKELLEKEAFITSPSELKEESRFQNLYQVKYLPFQGFRLSVLGYRKDSMKCGGNVKPSPKKTAKEKSGKGLAQ